MKCVSLFKKFGNSPSQLLSCLFLLSSCSASGPIAPSLAVVSPESPSIEERGPHSAQVVQAASSAQGTTHTPPSAGSLTVGPQSEAESSLKAPAFAPADPGPMYERSAAKGDGQWRAFFDSLNEKELKARSHQKVSPQFARHDVQRMVLHPHQASRFQSLTLAAFDLHSLEVHHVPGLQDVKDMNFPQLEERAGLIPLAGQSALLAVFNGGFQPRHGRWGMLSLGKEIVPPRRDACTVAIMKDGSLRIAPWTELEKERENIVAFRQTPPCLVSAGKIHERLRKGDHKSWAGQNEKRKTRRRSALALSANGKTLIYALGTETEPEVMAAGLVHAGAYSAAQLDINWNWTRLFLYDGQNTTEKYVGSLVPLMAKDRGEYLERPAKRGFFYLTQRKAMD